MDVLEQLAAVWAKRVVVLATALLVAATVFVWRSTAPEEYVATSTLQVRLVRLRDVGSVSPGRPLRGDRRGPGRQPRGGGGGAGVGWSCRRPSRSGWPDPGRARADPGFRPGERAGGGRRVCGPPGRCPRRRRGPAPRCGPGGRPGGRAVAPARHARGRPRAARGGAVVRQRGPVRADPRARGAHLRAAQQCDGRRSGGCS